MTFYQTLLTATNKASYRLLVLLWSSATVILALTDRTAALASVGTALFAVLLTWFTWRLVHPSGPEPVDTLRANGSRFQLSMQTLIVSVTVLWAMLYGWAFGSIQPRGRSMRIPHLSHLVWKAYGSPIDLLHDSWGTILGFVSLALIPGILMLLFGRSRPSVGLVAPARGTSIATLASIALALIFAVVGISTGKITIGGLALLLVHNFLSNGFTEEFLFRGLVMSQLRDRLSGDWAMVLQGLIFAAFHFGSTMPDKNVHGNIAYAIADNISLNAPMGVALGIMAVRGRSLVQGTITHMFLDTMTRTI